MAISQVKGEAPLFLRQAGQVGEWYGWLRVTFVPQDLEEGMIDDPRISRWDHGGSWIGDVFLALGVQSEPLKPAILVNSGIMFAGLAIVIGCGAEKMRLQKSWGVPSP